MCWGFLLSASGTFFVPLFRLRDNHLQPGDTLTIEQATAQQTAWRSRQRMLAWPPARTARRTPECIR